MEGVSDKKKFGTCPHTKVLLADVKKQDKYFECNGTNSIRYSVV